MTTLTERLTDARLGIQERSRLLRRVRALYVRVNRRAIVQDQTNASIIRCAQRMLETGMHAKATGERSVRQSILRKLWKMDVQDGKASRHWRSWHEWLHANSWSIGEGMRMIEIAEKAAS